MGTRITYDYGSFEVDLVGGNSWLGVEALAEVDGVSLKASDSADQPALARLRVSADYVQAAEINAGPCELHEAAMCCPAHGNPEH